MSSTQSPRMRLPEVLATLLCSRAHLYELNKRGVLRKYNDGRRFAYWLRSEVMAYAVGKSPSTEGGEA